MGEKITNYKKEYRKMYGTDPTYTKYAVQDFIKVDIEFDFNPYSINTMNVMTEWCEEHFGDNYGSSLYAWFFETKDEAMLFKLRWS